MKKLMRLLALLFAFALVAAACGGDSDDSADTEDDTSASASETGGDDDASASASEPADDGDEGTEAAGGGKIAVLLPDSASSARWENDDRRFLTEAFTAAGLVEGEDFTISNAEGDAATMQTQAEAALTDGATVLLMVPLDSGSGAAIIDTARAAGAVVIDYDRLTTEGDGADYYVSFDNVAVGRAMGESMAEALADFDGVPNVVVLDGGPTDNNATLFGNGYMEIAQPKFDSGEWNLVDRQAVDGWDNQEAQNIAEQILTAANNEVDAVIVANDGMAGGVISALTAVELNGIPVTGQDASAGGIQNIVKGDQYMTVYKAIKAEADAAAELALILRDGGTPDNATATVNNGTTDVPSVLLTPVAVTVDNINDTVIADGFRTVEEICVGDAAETEFCQN
ncbi:MAG: substrate-binding domain-containing protein [Actinomycetota bacterium]